MNGRNVRCYEKAKDPKGCSTVGPGLIKGAKLVRDWLNETFSLVWVDQPETHALPKPTRSRRRRGAARGGEKHWDDRNDRPETHALPKPIRSRRRRQSEENWDDDRNDRPETHALPIPKPKHDRKWEPVSFHKNLLLCCQ